MTVANEVAASTHKHPVLIVDDHPIVRQGLAQLMAQEADMTVCGGAASVADALEQVARLRPDLVLVDISLKESNGLDLLAELKTVCDHAKALVWSMFDETVYAERALRAGAMGYVNKQEPIEIVVAAMRQVLHGDVYVSPKMAEYLARRKESVSGEPASVVSLLSNRELEVFTLIGQGLTTNEIADRLTLSAKTVETHRERIKLKLKIKHGPELSRRAVLWVLQNG